MESKLPISALLQMSSSWNNLSKYEQCQLVEEGLFVEKTLEMVPIWESYSQEERQQIFFEAWTSYTQATNLKWVPNN